MTERTLCENCSTFRETPLYIGNSLVYNPMNRCDTCPALYEQFKAQFTEGDTTNADEH